MTQKSKIEVSVDDLIEEVFDHLDNAGLMSEDCYGDLSWRIKQAFAELKEYRALKLRLKPRVERCIAEGTHRAHSDLGYDYVAIVAPDEDCPSVEEQVLSAIRQADTGIRVDALISGFVANHFRREVVLDAIAHLVDEGRVTVNGDKELFVGG